IYDATTEEETQVFVNPNINSHRIDGLEPDHDYRISITACNRMGDSLPWDSRSKQWVPFKKVPGNVTKVEVPHLLDDVLYTFRVRAHNEAGLSEPTATAEYFRPGRGPEELLPGSHKLPPAPPIGPLKVEASPAQQRLDQATEQAQQTMVLSWSKPTRTDDVTEPKDPHSAASATNGYAAKSTAFSGPESTMAECVDTSTRRADRL
ncbi:unnamed protein product, partial [Dibothriocephalus latus]